MSENILEINNLSKYFGGLAAVSECSLKVKKGTITGIIGPNGSGKTTLFNLIAGNLKSSAGSVMFNNENITDVPSYELFSKGLLRTFQIAHEFTNLTVLENLMMVPGNQSGEKLMIALLNPKLVKKDNQMITKGIEVGHIFYFGDKYSKPMNCSVDGKDGKKTFVKMGSYGIGVSRLVAAIIEAKYKKDQMKWPTSVSPFDIVIIPAINKNDNSNLEKVTIAGKHCESGDVLLKDFLLPSCESGDFLAVFGTGAYNYSMSSNYNRIPRPATIMVWKGSAELTQRRELPEDLLQLDVLPDRFIPKN